MAVLFVILPVTVFPKQWLQLLRKSRKSWGLKQSRNMLKTRQRKKRVAELGVDFAQGYAVGKPRSLEVVIEALTGTPHRLRQGGLQA